MPNMLPKMRRQRPVMLHRMILGSLERWIGILIEEHAGRMPPWLAPVQCVVAPITEAANGYARRVIEALTAAGLRVNADLLNEKISYKVREHSVAKVPYIIAVGGREEEAETVALRRLGSEKQETLALYDVVNTHKEQPRSGQISGRITEQKQ